MLEIGAVTLQHLLETGSTLALLDVREHGEYNSAHIPGASSLPRRLLEHRIERLVPGKQTQVVVCDDTGLRARLAAKTLERLGYESCRRARRRPEQLGQRRTGPPSGA